jgi:hypothetical protein
MKTQRDETLEEIWAIRRELSKRFNFDPKKAAAYYRRKQKERGAKIFRPSEHIGVGQVLHDHGHAEIAVGKCDTLTSYSANRKRKAKRAK